MSRSLVLAPEVPIWCACADYRADVRAILLETVRKNSEIIGKNGS